MKTDAPLNLRYQAILNSIVRAYIETGEQEVFPERMVAGEVIYVPSADLAAAGLAPPGFTVMSPPGTPSGEPTTRAMQAVAPEYDEWAAFFAAGAAIRSAVEAGAVSAVSTRVADDQLRAAEQFFALVENSLGLLAA